MISYKSSPTEALICLPWLSLEDSTTLFFILLNKILEQKRSMTSESLYTVIVLLIKTKIP